MDQNAAMGAGMLIGIVSIGIGLAVGLVVGAYLLKAACWICRQEQPTLGSAMAIVFVNTLAQGGLNLVARFAIVPMVGGADPKTALVVVGGVFLAGIFISAAIYSAMIPTSFLVGVGIYFAQLLVLGAACGIPLIALFAMRPGSTAPAPPPASSFAFEAPDPSDTTPAADQAFLAEALGEFKSLGASSTRPAARVASDGVPDRTNPVAPAPNAAAGGDEIDQLLAALDDRETFKVRRAADRLGKLRPDDSRRSEVNAKLVKLLSDRDDFVRWSASNGLKVWADTEAVPALLTAIDDTSHPVRHNAIETLGALKDPRAADPLVAHMKSDKLQAVEALKKLGPAAEPAVLTALNDDEWTVRSDACKILKEIGGAASVPELRKHLLHDQNGIVRMNAEAALKAIGPVKAPAPVEAGPKAPTTTPKKKRRL